jgi:hypothetical protein
VQVTVVMTLTDPPRPCGGIGMIGEWMLRCVMMGREKHVLYASVNGFGCNEGMRRSAALAGHQTRLRYRQGRGLRVFDGGLT